jgi:hypothetical protein
MVGGDPREGSVYGFSSFDEDAGVLALRNPKARSGRLSSRFVDLVELPDTGGGQRFRCIPVYGETQLLGNVDELSSPLSLELPPFGIVVWEIEAIPASEERP